MPTPSKNITLAIRDQFGTVEFYAKKRNLDPYSVRRAILRKNLGKRKGPIVEALIEDGFLELDNEGT